MTEQRSPLDQALDLVFYAPVGLAITVREELPHLIEKGHQRVTSQVMMARMIGQFVAGKGQREVTKFAKQANDLLVGLGLVPTSGPASSPRPTAPVPPSPAGARSGAGPASGARAGAGSEAGAGSGAGAGAGARAGSEAGSGARSGAGAGSEAGAGAGARANGKAAGRAAGGAAPAVPTSEGLAIPGYDSLSASQVVQRLAGLAAGELEAVRGYEAVTRGRRTILNRIAQLQTGVG